jgi:hypothetical protein
MSVPQSPGEQIESVKRYVYGVAHAVYGNRHRYAGPAGFTPEPVELFLLLDKLINFILSRQLPLDTKTLRDFVEVETRRLYGTGTKGVPTSGIQFTNLPDCLVTPVEWLEKARALDDRLNDLTALLLAPGRTNSPPVPWSGPEWDALQDKPRRLLEFMHGKKTSEITDALCQYVWQKNAVEVEWSTINSTIYRANDYLTSMKWQKNLSKVRNEDRISWK